MRPVGRAVKLSEQLLDFEAHFRSSQEVIALRDEYPHVRIMHFEQSFVERSILANQRASDRLAMAPPYGSTTLGIRADGSIWPHGYTPYQAAPLFRLGTFPDVSLPWVWHESPELDGIRGWLRSLLERCHRCPEYQIRCAGLNFEMEVARQAGHIRENPYCISDMPIPAVGDFLPARGRPHQLS